MLLDATHLELVTVTDVLGSDWVADRDNPARIEAEEWFARLSGEDN